jgi:hypothetical protein
MSNEVMKRKWSKSDKELQELLKKIKRISYVMRDKIQYVLNDYDMPHEELFMYASEQRNNRFNIIIQEFEKHASVGLKIRNLVKRKKVKNYELLEALIILYNLERNQKLMGELSNTLKKNTSIAYDNAIEECKEIQKSRKKKFRLKEDWLYELLILPSYNGMIWMQYMESLAYYYANEIFKRSIVDIQQGIKPNVDNADLKAEFERQDNALLKRKMLGTEDVPEYMDKYSGSIDALNTYCMNKAMLEAYINYGIKEVKFVAEEDEKTTKMCKSLDGQIFKIDGINEYVRYSAMDEGIVNYTTDGLQVGANLPPISNHFHWCRSTIIPIRNTK